MNRFPRVLLALIVLFSGAALAPQIALPSEPFNWQLYAGAYQPSPVPVHIKDFAFAPQTILIPVGTTVRWTNDGNVIHTVTSDTAGLFNSGDLNPGGTFEHRFDTLGTHTYTCTRHPGMRGTVIVANRVLSTYLPMIFKLAP